MDFTSCPLFLTARFLLGCVRHAGAFVVVLMVLLSREMHLGKPSLLQHFSSICTGWGFTEVSNGRMINNAFQRKLHFLPPANSQRYFAFVNNILSDADCKSSPMHLYIPHAICSLIIIIFFYGRQGEFFVPEEAQRIQVTGRRLL